MPEYLAPGVYVQEVASGVKPIAGVSTSTTTFFGTDTFDKLRHKLRRVPAGERERGAASDTQDPAAAVLELAAWLTEQVALRSTPIPDEALPHAARLGAAALSLVADRELPLGSGLQRARFMPGRTLGADGSVT